MTFDDARRLDALRDYRVLDTPVEESFDNLAALAAKIFGTPIALVSLVDQDRQWFKARVGLDLRETPREYAFCDHAIRGEGVMVVPDATRDPRFAHHPLVTGDPNIRFYGGVPLRTPDGMGLGTLCVLDRVPRTLSPHELMMLEALGRQVEIELEIRRRLGLLEEALANQEQNQKANQLVVSMLVHDLRSPLTSILMLATLLQPVDEASGKRIEMLLEETERVRRMLTDVLDLCLHEAGELRLRRVEFPLRPLAQKVVQRMSGQAMDRNQSIRLEFEDSPLIVSADPQLLERVLDNLLGNAIHHGPVGEPITLAIRTQGEGTLRVEVRDLGDPIPAPLRECIFNPFERVPAPNAQAHLGYGLGLAFCRLAVEAHGGKIGVTPGGHGGNCFHFEIPTQVA